MKKSIVLGVLIIVFIGVFYKYELSNRGQSETVPKKITIDKDTEVYAVLNIPMENKNMVWCGTMSLAWNEFRDNIVKEDIKLEGEVILSSELNKKPFTKENLNDKDYIAMVGYNRDGIVDKVNRKLKEKFDEEGEWKAEALKRPDDFLAYSFLKKNVHFKKAFEVLKDGMAFKGKRVEGFGIDKIKESKKSELKSQIELLSYNNGDDFIIRLIGEKEDDELVVAKIPPKGSLKETLDYALTNRNTARGTIDKFKMPKVAFKVEKNFKELEDRNLLNKGFEDHRIEKAMQSTMFTLTEKGAELKSKTELNGKGDSAPMEKLNLVVDKSFLIYMKEAKTDRPYFVLWVDNERFMIEK